MDIHPSVPHQLHPSPSIYRSAWSLDPSLPWLSYETPDPLLLRSRCSTVPCPTEASPRTPPDPSLQRTTTGRHHTCQLTFQGTSWPRPRWEPRITAQFATAEDVALRDMTTSCRTHLRYRYTAPTWLMREMHKVCHRFAMLRCDSRTT